MKGLYQYKPLTRKAIIVAIFMLTPFAVLGDLAKHIAATTINMIEDLREMYEALSRAWRDATLDQKPPIVTKWQMDGKPIQINGSDMRYIREIMRPNPKKGGELKCR